MKRRMISIIFLLFILLLSACGAQATRNDEEMISLVEKFQTATNEENWEEAASYMAEDVVYAVPQGTLVGRDVWLTTVTKEGGGIFEDVQNRRVDGNKVIVEMIVTGPDFKSPAVAEVIVENGKIQSYTVTPP